VYYTFHLFSSLLSKEKNAVYNNAYFVGRYETWPFTVKEWTMIMDISVLWDVRPHGLIYRVSHELRLLLRESVPYVKIYRYNAKHLCPKLNGYGDNGQRKVGASCGSTYCTC
jgi:hypothetical protein